MRSRRIATLMACALALTLVVFLPSAGPQQGVGAEGTAEPLACEGAPGAGDPYYPQDGNGGYLASSYDVAISYSPEEQHLDGDATMTARAEHDLCRFNLDLRELDVTSVDVNGQRAEFTRADRFELVITPAETIETGAEFTTRVNYQGNPATAPDPALGRQGWHISSSGGAFALGQPHSAAFWFPVNDTPRDKATFRLSARVPQDWVAVSIGIEGEHTTEAGWTTYVWEEPNPVASYLTTIAIDRFTLDRSELADGTPVVSAYGPGATSQRQVERRLADVVEFLSGLLGGYPQSSAGGIYLADSLGFALETQGRPTYPAWADERILVHEYAHQWFGNSVTISAWADLCLNECLASYTEWLWAEHDSDADLDERYRNELSTYSGSSGFWRNQLYDMGAGNEFNGVYNKGALAMHALRSTIGKDAFLTVLRDWVTKHEHGNASWPEFEQFVSERTGRDLDGFFDAWFRGTEMPAERYLCPGTLRCP